MYITSWKNSSRLYTCISLHRCSEFFCWHEFRSVQIHGAKLVLLSFKHDWQCCRMLLAFSNCMYMYALLFLTAHKMYLNILFIFWPHRLQFSPTKFSSSRMVAVGPGCWSIYSKILHVKRIPYAKYMNLLFHRSALYRRLPYIFFFYSNVEFLTFTFTNHNQHNI